MKLKIKTLAGMGKLFSRLTLKTFIGNGDGASRRSRRTCGPAIWLGLMFVGANAALLGVPSAHAATTLYDVQFNSSSLYQQTGAAVIGQTGDYWNRLATASGTSALANTAGAASGGSLTWSASGMLVGGTANPSFGNGDADLMDGYIYCSSGSQNITFSNLTANAPFTLYIYTQGDSATTGRRLSVTFNGSTYTSSAAVAGATAFVSGQNYLTISGTTTASGTLPFSYTYAVGEADINGLQLSVANIAPAIAAQPASQTLAVGGMVNLNVTPAGTAPFFYQWFKNGGVVLGATNSALTYSNAGVTNSGVYYVVITNSVGLCISQPAAVTVGTPQLLAWGENTSGQLGDGTTISRSLPESVATNAVTAAAGETHSLYVKSDGTLWAMGGNAYGQLGDGTLTTRSNAVSVAVNVVSVTAGRYHSLYLKNDGTLWAMGFNGYGQLGDGTQTNRSNAVSVASNVVAVAAGYYHSLYLKNDGTLWAMGANNDGQLGDGTLTTREIAELVASNVVTVASGGLHSLYVKGDGTLWTMGWNTNGQLGDGTLINRSNAVSVASNVVAVAAGYFHSLYAKSDGTLWTMGYNGYGELGDGTLINRSNAVSVASNVVTVTGEFSDSMFLKNDGTLWGMGDNELGELGDGTTTQRTSPVSVSGMSLANIISGEDSIWTFGVGVPLPPTIISQPTNRTVTAGGTVTFTVTASGFAPLACQWQFNGTNINGATATNYVLTGVTATNAGNYTVVVSNPGGSVTSSVSVLTINKSTPTVTAWPTATAIIYGQTLTASTLNGGSASVPGSFAFTAPSTAPGVGTASQAVTFTPTDTTDYNAVTNSVSVTVNKATPVVTTWPTATAITYGQTLAASTLNGGLASVPGNFAFTTPSTAPTTTALQGVTFTPTDTADYNAVTNSVSVTVNKVTPVVTTWPTATAITYGQTLAASTLSGGAASVDGSFAFTLPSTAPGAGTAVQSVVFTPTDLTDYNAVGNSVSVTVDKATATVVFHPTPLLATCDGTAKSVTATTVPSGLTVAITYNGAGAAPTNAGIYTVIGIISDANYEGGATNQLSIAMTGPAVAWGMGTSGQLGNGGSTNSPLPVAILNSGVLAGKTIVGVAGGSAHSYALTSEGLVYAWGNNSYGELGNNGTASSPVPVMVYTNGALSGKKITAIASGENHALALSADGLLFTWGWNNNLQLGNGSTVSYTNVPVAVDMTGVLAGKTVVALGTGNMHNQVVTSDGQIFTWGYGQFGQLGNGATTNSGVPVAVDMNGVLSGKTVIAASGGWEHTVALTSDGLVYTWGAGENYQLGNGATTNSSVPVAVATDGVLSGKTIVAIAAGEYHCLAVSSEGQVYSWGPNSNGELGNGTSTPSSVPVAVSTDGALSGKTVVSVRGTYDSSVALTDDGQVFSWGYNGNGELGNPAYANYSYVPVPVDESGALAGLVVSAISSSSQAYHVIALTIGLTAPALTSATTVTGIYGEAFTFTVAGNCVESYSATGLPGWLAFDPATGILSGTPTMTGVFDITLVATNAFGSTSGNLAITVNKSTPVVTTWPTATAITYGQTLADSTLSGGSASVDGSFAFTTPSTQPAVGTAQQVVTFTPKDTADYNTVSSMTVAGMSLHCTGSFGPTTTLNGVELGAETAFSMVATFDPTLNLAPFPPGSGVGVYAATASITIDGYGTYQSAAGADFNIWLMNPTEMFVPFYAAGFGDQSGENGVSQIFNSTTSPFFAEAPTPTTFSDNLGPDQGNFPFAIPLGDGTSSLVVNDLGAATFTAEIIGGGTQLTGPEVTVNKITPVVTTWPTAAAITYGQTLAASTLSGGSASVDGSFAFTTPSTAPGVGTALQWVTFNPTDTTDYNTVSNSVSVTVTNPLPPIMTVTVAADPTNAGSVTVDGVCYVGSNVVLTATASNHWQFVSWNDGTTNNPYTITVPATNIAYTASFLPTRTVTALANPTNAGSAMVAGVCYVGSNVVLTATASNNWQFVSWNDGTTNNPYVITVPDTNITYTAEFAATATITVDASPSNGGLVTGGGTFLVGSTNFITASASNNWVFTRWSDAVTDKTRAIVITTNRTWFFRDVLGVFHWAG
jgi:alpha-tubulin suppressor-like RCC1 family protein